MLECIKAFASLLDHVYIAAAGIDNAEASVVELHVSDHCATNRAISTRVPKLDSTHNIQQHYASSYRNIKKLDDDMLCADLSSAQWFCALSSAQSVDDMISAFNNIFLSVWNKHAPLISRRVHKRRNAGMSDDVIDLVHKRDVAYKTFLNTWSEMNHMAYKILRNAVNNAVRQAKRKFFIKGAHGGGRHIWRTVKQCTGLGRMKSTSALWLYLSTTAAKLSANRVNDELIEIKHKAIGNRVSSLTKHASSFIVHDKCAQFSLHHESARKIRCIVDSLPAKSSIGSDGISVTVLKKLPFAVYNALEQIFNSPFDQEIFPYQSKKALITLIYKKGNMYDPVNYRPIALLSLISKVVRAYNQHVTTKKTPIM